MQTALTLWRLLQMFGMIGVPQLLGVLAYFRLRKYHDFLAHLVGFLIPPILFVYLSRVMLIASVQEIQAQGERVCGTFTGMMVIMILFGTGVHVVLSLMAQLLLHGRQRTSTMPK